MSKGATAKGKSKKVSGAKLALAEHIRTYMEKKGWGPTETARQASALLPGDQSIAPASISHYCSGRAIPRPQQLAAIAKVLGIPGSALGLDLDFGTLSPPSTLDAGPDSNLIIEDQGNGVVRLRVNQNFSWPTAMKVLQVLKDEMVRAAQEQEGAAASSKGEEAARV